MELMDLHKDPLFMIGLELGFDEINTLCRTNSRFNNLICKNNTFWLYKLKRDFPEIFKAKLGPNPNYRTIYLSLHDKIYSYFSSFLSGNIVLPYIKLGMKMNEGDTILAKKLYSDNVVASSFKILGVYPKGTEIYYEYHPELRFPRQGPKVERNYDAFLTREDVIDEILEKIEKLFLIGFYDQGFNKGRKYYKKILQNDDKVRIEGPRDYVDFDIYKFIIADYSKIVEKLDEEYPDWKDADRNTVMRMIKELEKKYSVI